MRMTAAVMYEQGLPKPFVDSSPFRIEEVELEAPADGEVLIELRAAGLCHSDLSVVEGQRKRPLPIVGGHEGAGIIRELGRGVTGLAVGDHVVLTNVSGCGQCRACLAGRPVLCQAVSSVRAEGKIATGARRLRLADGGRLNHYSGLSVFAQYAVVAPDSLVVIDKRVPMDVAAMFGCGIVTGAGAVFNTAKVQRGESVAVIGLGGVGLSAVMAAKESGASRIVGIDVLSNKFDLARAVGATDCIDARDPKAVQQVLDLTHGGVDHSFEVSGNPGAFALAQAIAARGAQVVFVGAGAPDTELTVKHLSMVIEERVLRGSFMGSCVPQRDIPRYVNLYLQGQLPVDRLRSDHIGFDRLNESLDLLARGAVVRQILLPHGVKARA